MLAQPGRRRAVQRFVRHWYKSGEERPLDSRPKPLDDEVYRAGDGWAWLENWEQRKDAVTEKAKAVRRHLKYPWIARKQYFEDKDKDVADLQRSYWENK